MTLLDTNVLLRIAMPMDPDHSTTIAAVTNLQDTGEDLCVVPQNLYELWAVATRPQAANGLGLTASLAQTVMAGVVASFRLLDDRPALFTEWSVLVGTHQCLGRVSFDARLVAAMRTHGLARLLTFNLADFARFPGLTLLDPRLVAKSVLPS